MKELLKHMGFLDIVRTAVEVGAALSMSSRITRWVELDPAAGDRAMEAFVNESSVELIDAMDETFFHYLRGAMMPTQKVWVPRLYGMLKVEEFARFRKFRGFPVIE